jgi:hypothetical protein
MSMYHYIGSHAALESFQLTKQAGLYSQMTGGIKNFVAPENLRRIFVGDPARAIAQAKDGTGFQPGGVFRDALVPPTTQGKALSWGLPALGTALAASAPAEYRGSAMGAALGGSVGNMLGSPFGAAGMVGGGMLGSALGGTLGRPFNKDPAPQEEIPSEDAYSSLRGTMPLPYTNEVGAVQAP